MHIKPERRIKTIIPTFRANEANAARAAAPTLSRTEYRRMVAEILG